MAKNNRGLFYTHRSREYLEMRQNQVRELKKLSPEEKARRVAILRKKLQKN